MGFRRIVPQRNCSPGLGSVLGVAGYVADYWRGDEYGSVGGDRDARHPARSIVRQRIVAIRGRPQVAIGWREETCRRAWVPIFGYLTAGDGNAATTNAGGEEYGALSTALQFEFLYTYLESSLPNNTISPPRRPYGPCRRDFELPTLRFEVLCSARLRPPASSRSTAVERTGHLHRATVNLGFPQTELRC